MKLIDGMVFQFIANVKFTRNNVDNHSHFYKVDPETGSAVHGVIKNDTRFAMLGHFFASNGLRGEVSAERPYIVIKILIHF